MLLNLKKILTENIIISFLLFFLIVFFSDYSLLNLNLKLNLLNFFFLTNIYELFNLDKINYYKINIYISFVIFSLIFQLYIISFLYSNFKKKISYFFNLLFFISFIYFFLNLIKFEFNFLPFDKLWISFLLSRFTINYRFLILLNRFNLLIFFFFIINYYFFLNIYIYFFLFLILSFLLNLAKFNFVFKNKFYYSLYLIILILLINVNYIWEFTNYEIKKYNLHHNLSKNNFKPYHFTKKKFNQNEINDKYIKCLNSNNFCYKDKEKLLYVFGDTQAHQHVESIKNSKNSKLVYLSTKKQCLLSRKLKHNHPLFFLPSFDRINSCSENFDNMINILKNSNKFQNNKIIYFSSWYNWYSKRRIIFNNQNQPINNMTYYEILFDDLVSFVDSFSNRDDILFVFLLPLPRFNYSPNSCFLNPNLCKISYDNYNDQINDLKNILIKISHTSKNFKIIEPGILFCDKNKNSCSMKDMSNAQDIVYRDNENISSSHIINFDFLFDN